MNISIDEKLKRCKAFVYDIEIYSAVPSSNQIRDPALHYCNGWDDYVGMGISVVTAYDFFDESYKVYLQDNLNDLKTTINSREVIIGFNNKNFDDVVLEHNHIHIQKQKSYDLWDHIVHSVQDGLGTRRGFSLNEMLKANDIPVKTGLGSDAPMLAQTNQWGKLINYCLSDTKLTVYLLRLACADVMKSPKTGRYMKIKKPWENESVDLGGLFNE